jgi:hypothetical protein
VWDEERKTWVLHVRKDEAGPRFGVHRYNRENLEQSPQVAFDIRIMPGTMVNVLFYIEKKYYAVRLTGGDQLPVIGEVPGVTADGKWHHVSFDARAMFRKSVPELQDLDARMCAIAGWSDGNEVGASFDLDNFALIGPRPPLPLFNYSDADATGISRYRISFDQNPTSTEGTETTSSRSGKELLAADKAGMWYVHAAACDGAGNWSETVHYPYLCTAPVPESHTEGLEADGTWRPASGRRRARGYVYKASTPSGDKLLGVQIVATREGELEIRNKLTDTPLAGTVKLSASVYSGASDPLKMHAVLKGYSGRTLTSDSVELKPGEWSRNAQFVFPEALPKDKDKAGERWTLSFIVSVGRRSRDVLVLDEILLSSEKLAAAKAPAAGK